MKRVIKRLIEFKVWLKVENQVRAQTWKEVDYQVWLEVRDQVDLRRSEEARSQSQSQIWDQILQELDKP